MLIPLFACGLVLAIEGATKGQLPHRLFSVGVALLLCAPLIAERIGGRPALQAMRRGVFYLGPTLLFLCGAELVARQLGVETWAWPQQRASAELEYQYLPHSGGMDAWGFRNLEVPSKADVVVLGDSMTFGFGVLRAEAYPHVLGGLAGRTVYNMGLGQYGPVQYYGLAPRAALLEPSVVVIAVFLGNDMLDAHRVGTRAAWLKLGEPDGPDPALIPLLDVERRRASPSSVFTPRGDRSYVLRMLFELERRSRSIGWVTTRLRTKIYTSRYLAGIYRSEPGAPRYEGPDVSTLFAPEHRSKALDLEAPEVRKGLELTTTALQRTRRLFERSGTRVVLLVVHTKEFYYRDFLTRVHGHAPDSLERLHVLEDRLTDELVRMARAAGLETLDTLDAISMTLEAGKPAFFTNVDPHMAPAGHLAIARLLAERLAGPVPERSRAFRPR